MPVTDRLGPYELNEIYTGECSEAMAQLPDACIDLTVTSPPYDNLRKYNGYVFPFEAIAGQLYRVTKPGGVVVWVVGDETKNGTESGNSFRQALYFMGLGFNLHDTMIWHKSNAMPQVDHSRFAASFEYMFVLSKGKPSKAHPVKEKTKNGGVFLKRGDGNPQNINKVGGGIVNTDRIAFNVRILPVGETNYGHPAPFPEALARDHVLSWSNPGDLVLDPMMGSGTVAKMAKLNGRQWLGFDISQEYVDLARRRVQMTQPPLMVLQPTEAEA